MRMAIVIVVALALNFMPERGELGLKLLFLRPMMKVVEAMS